MVEPARSHAKAGALPTRRLGRTDMDITRVGFGAWAIGGAGWAAGWGAQDDRDSIAAIRHAVERGINWIDTAAIYGLGHSEEVVRQTLAGMAPGERPYIFTKCGLVWDEHNRTAPPRQVRIARVPGPMPRPSQNPRATVSAPETAAASSTPTRSWLP